MQSNIITALKQLNIITSKNQVNKQGQRMVEKHPILYQQIVEKTHFLDQTARLTERLFCISANIKQRPTCLCCNTFVKYKNNKKRYDDFCSAACGHTSGISAHRLQQTMLDKYGVSNISHLPATTQKRHDTMINKYGYKTAIENPTMKEKMKQTMLDRYGIVNWSSLPENILKRKQTMLDRYGSKTWAEQQVSDQSKQTLQDKQQLISLHHVQQKTLTDIGQTLDVSTTTVCRYFKHHAIDVNIISKINILSAQQEEIVSFLKQHTASEIVINDKKQIAPYHLDIFLPEYKLAIELNGVYWHTQNFGGKDKEYHLSKTTACKQKQIKLIHIWDVEWNTKQNIVKSRLLSKIKCSKKIGARTCKVIKLTRSQEKNFMERTHLQRYVSSFVCYALIDKNQQILAAMSFIKPRYNKNVQWELLRFSCEENTQIIGGGSKLFAHFIKQHAPTSVISYSDIRWGAGEVYYHLGFALTKCTSPNYFYINMKGDTSRLYSRIKFQKHKLRNSLQFFDENKSEWDNMKTNGFDRVWDCGNSVFLWKKEYQ